MIWTEFCTESPISGERRVAEGFFLGKFAYRAGLGELDGVLHGNSDSR